MLVVIFDRVGFAYESIFHLSKQLSIVRFLLTSELRLICSTLSQGEVTEWPIVHPWKGCVGVTPPRVRIPPSPPLGAAQLGKREEPSVKDCVIIDAPHLVPLDSDGAVPDVEIVGKY